MVEIFALLGCYAALIGNVLLMIQDNLSVTNYQWKLCNISEGWRSHWHHGGSL